jgi:putative flippase GtrA
MVDMTSSAFGLNAPVVAVPESWRLRMRRAHPFAVQATRYVIVGALGTVANAVIFLVLRTGWDAIEANLVALVLSTLLSTEVNRRFTFRGAGPVHRWRTYAQNGGTVGFYAFYSSAVLIALGILVDDPSPWLESVAVAAASILGGAGRFLLMRYWVFEGAPGRGAGA